MNAFETQIKHLRDILKDRRNFYLYDYILFTLVALTLIVFGYLEINRQMNSTELINSISSYTHLESNTTQIGDFNEK